MKLSILVPKLFRERVDMTSGNPVRQILLAAFPLLLVNVISIFTASMTSNIYSTYVGSDAFAVTSALVNITSLYVNILGGMISAAQIYLARCIGAGDRDKISNCIVNAAYLLVILHLSLGLTLVLGAEPILRLLNIPEQIFAKSLLYFRFYIGFYFFSAMSSMLISFIVSFGNVEYIFLLHITNLLLGLTFAALYLAVFRIDIVGVALIAASNGLVLSNIAVPMLLGGKGWRKKLKIKLGDRRNFSFDAAIVKNIFTRGLLIAAQTVLVSIGALYASAVINKNMSLDYIATLSMSFPLTAFYSSISTALSIFCAQNYGKGDYERVRAGIRCSLILLLSYSVFSMAAFIFLSGWYFKLLGFGGAVLELVVVRYRWYALAMPFLAVISVFRFALDSLGCSKYSVFAGVCELSGYVLSASVLIPAFWEAAASSVYTVSWMFSALYLVVIYFIKKKTIFRKNHA